MAKIGEMLGFGGNPFYDIFASNRQALSGAFGGAAANPSNPWGGASQGVALGQQQDDAYATQQKAEAERLKGLNSTLEFMRAKGYDDLVSGVEGGGLDMDAAWGEALKRSAPGYGQTDQTSDMQNYSYYANDEMKAGRSPMPFGQWVKGSAAPAAPSGYRATQDGNLTYIPGGPADPSTPAKTTEATRRNQQLSSMIGPELQTVEQNWDELASGTNQAANAVPFGAGYGATSPGYQQATNSLATIAQSYLYSVSGAAAPAEEVKKLVDSVTPKPFESAQSIADKKSRIRQMAAAVQEAAGGAPMQQPAPGGQTSTGLSWSIEP